MPAKEILTTFEAARICSVSYNTIKNWIRRGFLEAYRTVGGHLRIKNHDIEVFCRKYGIPIGVLTKGAKRKILLVNGEKETQVILRETINQCPEKFDIFTAENCFEAGMITGIHKPDLVIVDLAAPGVDTNHLSQMVRKTHAIKHAKILVLGYDGLRSDESLTLKLGADICLPRPIVQPVFCRAIKVLLKPSSSVRTPKRNRRKK